MQELNLPPCNLKTEIRNGKSFIYDAWRKKYILLTPEEWVRQNFLSYLVQHKNYPHGLISVERILRINKLNFRTDAVVYSKTGQPVLLIEFKAPTIEIDEKTLFQAAKYNKSLSVPYLILSNGLSHYCLDMNDTAKMKYMEDIPSYSDL